MKKILLVGALFAGISASSQNMMVVDSVKVLPQNPTALDSVFLHVYWHSNYGCGLQMPMNVVHSGSYNHTVTACYVVGVITIITSGDDSIFLFQGPAGMHTVAWQVQQNASQSTSCDYTHATNQVQVNVIPTGIEEHASSHQLELTNGKQALQCNQDGLLSIYSMTGQVLLATTVRNGQLITIKAEAGQMYFAMLQQENGEVTTLKFVIE